MMCERQRPYDRGTRTVYIEENVRDNEGYLLIFNNVLIPYYSLKHRLDCPLAACLFSHSPTNTLSVVHAHRKAYTPTSTMCAPHNRWFHIAIEQSVRASNGNLQNSKTPSFRLIKLMCIKVGNNCRIMGMIVLVFGLKNIVFGQRQSIQC